jgi:hypothetical protein
VTVAKEGRYGLAFISAQRDGGACAYAPPRTTCTVSGTYVCRAGGVHLSCQHRRGGVPIRVILLCADRLSRCEGWAPES